MSAILKPLDCLGCGGRGCRYCNPNPANKATTGRPPLPEPEYDPIEAAAWHLARRFFVVGMVLLFMALLGALAGCGGGDPEDNPLEADARKGFDPVPCELRPELCK